MKKQFLLSYFILFSVNLIRAQVTPSLEWQDCLGGTNNEASFSVQQTIDGGFISAGFSESNDGNASGNHGSSDYWIVKLNSDSTLAWQKSLGGNSIDQANT